MSSPEPSLNEIADASTFCYLRMRALERSETYKTFRSDPMALRALVMIMRRSAVIVAERRNRDPAAELPTPGDLFSAATSAANAATPLSAAEEKDVIAAAAAISISLDTVADVALDGSSTDATNPPVNQPINTSDLATRANAIGWSIDSEPTNTPEMLAKFIGSPTNIGLTAVIRMLADASPSNAQ